MIAGTVHHFILDQEDTRCINVTAGGQISGAGTHVSVLVHLMRGEYDSRLVWPFRGDITIQLVNHNNDQDHREYILYYSMMLQ